MSDKPAPLTPEELMGVRLRSDLTPTERRLLLTLDAERAARAEAERRLSAHETGAILPTSGLDALENATAQRIAQWARDWANFGQTEIHYAVSVAFADAIERGEWRREGAG